MREKGFVDILIVAVVAVIVVGVGGYFLVSKKQPEPFQQRKSIDNTKSNSILPISESKKESVSPSTDPTANWKTYRAEKFGFLLKIPNDWQDPPQGEGRNLHIKLETESSQTFLDNYGFEGIFLDADSMPVGTTLDNYVSYKQNDFNVLLKTLSSKRLTIGEASAIQMELDMSYEEWGSDHLSFLATFIKGPNFFYMLRNKPRNGEPNSAISNKAKDIHNTILSTMEFF